jgi:hypothetical protein
MIAAHYCDGPDAWPLPSRPDPACSDWGDWKCVCCDPPRTFCQDCGASLDPATMECSAYAREKAGNARP